MNAVCGESVRDTRVTTVIPMKWPIKGMNPQIKTNMDSGPVYGMPIANPIIKMNKEARIAIIPCPPTNEPMREMIALVNFATRSLREFGTKRRPIFTTLSSEDRK